MPNLIGVDWGTSALRVARLGDAGEVFEKRDSERGILTVPEGGFPAVLQEACGDWLAEPGSMAVVCGMAGSRQGWIEAPYCPCPAGFDEIASHVVWAMPGKVAMVPGLSCEVDGVPDVMRGEETKAMGALSLLQLREATLLMPGTHSKWASVKDGRVLRFSTFMTGEFYALLRKHSILARTMPQGEGAFDADAFHAGVDHAARAASVLHGAFSARTLSLFGRLPSDSAHSYLSGLLIGEEMRAQRSVIGGGPLVLVASKTLTKHYAAALQHIGAAFTSQGEQAVWYGLHAIAQRLKEAQP